jgi:hypothetical protein
MEQILSIFDTKYTEFCDNLLSALPELEAAILASKELSPADRLNRFKDEVLPGVTPTSVPRKILPTLTLTDDIWDSLGETGQKAIQEFLSVLGVCSMSESDVWSDEFLNKWKESMSAMDFDGIAKKIADMFGKAGPGLGAGAFAGMAGMAGALPKIPEKLMKGQLAKLVEELVKEFKPEEFGFTPEIMEECEKNPARAFEVITEIYTKRPEALQGVLKRIMKRLQDKIRRGEFKPQEIAKEAEEMMKEFTGNPAFMELLTSLKDGFGAAEDPDLMRETGREGDARRNIVRDRLKARLAAKKGGGNKK